MVVRENITVLDIQLIMQMMMAKMDMRMKEMCLWSRWLMMRILISQLVAPLLGYKQRDSSEMVIRIYKVYL